MTLNKINLHIHTTASDGHYTPIEVLKKAKAIGLETVSITDHDNINGIREIENISKNWNIEIISGVELTADYPNGQCHILGYGVELNYIEKFSEEIKKNRMKKAKKIISLLNKDGFSIQYDETLKITPNKIIGRRNIATVLKNKGYFTSEDVAISKLLAKGKKYYIETKKKTIQDCLDAIKKSGGISVLAHPWTLNLSLYELEIFIKNLKYIGLEGIEVFNHEISNDISKYLIAISKRLDLYITCGTDYHGSKGLTELVVKEDIDCSKILKKLRGNLNGCIK